MIAADVISIVRELLKDNYVGSYRWSDVEMRIKLKEACTELSRRRSDALFTTAVPTTLVIADIEDLQQTLQINDYYKEALSYYVCARCLERDSDDQQNLALAQSYQKSFYRFVG